MYCPKCGGLVVNNQCKDCKSEIRKSLLALSEEKTISKQDKTACLIAYILFPVSKFMKIEDKKTVSYHQNQGFTLFLVELLTVASFFIPTIGGFVGKALVVLDCYLAYKGISNVLQGEQVKLPLIGDFVFL